LFFMGGFSLFAVESAPRRARSGFYYITRIQLPVCQRRFWRSLLPLRRAGPVIVAGWETRPTCSSPRRCRGEGIFPRLASSAQQGEEKGEGHEYKVRQKPWLAKKHPALPAGG
jgi:hypothetical protein